MASDGSMKMPFPAGLYKDRVVLVTGGGTGLGLACGLQFAALGAKVVVTGRRERPLQEAKEQLLKAGAPAALAISMDVRLPESVRAGIDRIETEFGQPPCVVLNNAAGNFVSPSEKLSPNAWKSIIDIVLMGTIHVTTDVAKRWIAKREAKRGPHSTPQVVFMQVGASYVYHGMPFVAPSSVAKSALLALTEALAVEWGKYNMRLFMVSPGPIYTKGAMSRLDPTGQFQSGGGVQDILPMQRLGTTQEYAMFVAYACSPYGSWITGVNLPLDGGATTAGSEFQTLRKVTPEQWSLYEKVIRKNNAADKAQRLSVGGQKSSKL